MAKKNRRKLNKSRKRREKRFEEYPKETQEDIRKLVIARLREMPNGLRISIG